MAKYDLWKKTKRIAQINSDWVDIYCEQWIDDKKQMLDYWRVEKADSVIIIPVYDNELLLPLEQFRPGVGYATLDFPGGRVHKNKTLEDSIYLILKKELGIKRVNVSTLMRISKKASLINSSFSNQKLYVYLAQIDSLPKCEYHSYKVEDYKKLSGQLECLQCLFALNLYINLEK